MNAKITTDTQTDRARLARRDDSEIDYSDAPPMPLELPPLRVRQAENPSDTAITPSMPILSRGLKPTTVITKKESTNFYGTISNMTWLDEIRWTSDGLIPVIAQQTGSGRVVMFAWMNRESLALTVQEGYAVYWSRSRGKLWRKGEESGHRQKVISIQLDCDEDVILLEIEQEGGIACHTGRQSCFYRQLLDGQWQAVEPVLKDPKAIYALSPP
jgi:phosphoribosyl-AMP cyclohydrolase